MNVVDRPGRQVLHFRPFRYERFSQALELTSGALIPGQAPLLQGRTWQACEPQQTLVFLAISGGLVLAAGGAAIDSTQKQRPAVARLIVRTERPGEDPGPGELHHEA